MLNSAECERSACSCTFVRVCVCVGNASVRAEYCFAFSWAIDFVMLLSVCMGGPPRAGPMESSTALRNRLNVYSVIDSVSLDPGPSPLDWGGVSVRLDWNGDYGDRAVIVVTIPWRGGGYMSDSTGTATVVVVQSLSRLSLDDRMRDGASRVWRLAGCLRPVYVRSCPLACTYTSLVKGMCSPGLCSCRGYGRSGSACTS